MLKKFIQTALLLVVLFTTVKSYAQVSQAPDGIQFQALATDANGHPAAGRVIYVKDAIVAKTATGTIVYSETFKVTASSAGIFTIVLGKGTYASGVSSIANIDWANGPFFLNLKIAVEPTVPNAGWNANNEYVDLGTSQFWSVPYALYAGNVKGADTKLNIADTAAMLKPYFTAINLKANIESPTFTGTVKGITKAMVGLGNVDNTSDIDKPISTATKTALDLKANAADVATALALKANTADVNAALNLKANATDVTTALDLKVDKVTGKALSTNDYTTAEKTKLAAITGTNTGDQDLSALAVAADVNAGLALKANTADVTAALDTKVSSADATAALALKANTADVNAALALKANGANVANSLALKANTTDVNTALALKADNAVVTSQLAAKENTSNKSVNINTDAASDVKYPSVKSVKTYVDAQVAGATISDADANTKGKIQLTGDLAGTAAAPTVPGLALKENLTNKSVNIATDGASDIKYPSVKSVKSYVDAQVAGATIADADANTKGKIQLTGDLGGTAAAPTVPGLALKAPLASPTFTGTVTTDIINTGALSATSVTAPTYASAPKALSYSGSTINWDPAQGLNASVTLTQNSTLSFTAAPPVGSYGTVVLTQDATGNRTITLPTINGVANKVLGSASTSTVALSTAANAKDILNFYFDGSSCYWNIGQGYGTAATPVSSSTNLASSVSGTLPIANGGTGQTTLSGVKNTLGLLSSKVAIGADAGLTSQGNDAIAIGYNAGLNNQGASSIAIGYLAGGTATQGSSSIAIGPISGGGGNNSVAIGLAAWTGANNATAVGTLAAAGHVNSAALGYQAVTTSPNTIQLGADGVTVQGSTAITNVRTSGSLTAGAVTYPNTNGTSGQVLTANNNGNASWTTIASVADASTMTGTVAITKGGTGATTATAALTNLGAAPIASPTFTGTVTTGAINAGAITATSVNSPIYASTPQALTAGSAISWNPALGLNASVTLNQNSTLEFSTTPLAGAYGTLVITQGTGGNFTLTLPSTTNKVLGSTSATTVALSTAAGAKDIVNFYYDGINCYWNVGQGYGTAATTASTNLATSVSGTLPVANGGTGATTLTGLVKGTGTSALTAAVAGTDYLAPNGSAASLTNFPTFNQNTTGNAATVTTNANLTGDVTSVGNTATVVKINGTSLASLSTGILKNTTSTGVPTIAVAGTDYQMPINLTTTGTGAATLSGTTLNIPAVSSTVNASTISGTVGIANGGTGLSTTPANGQIDIGNGTGFTRATLTAGTAITITNTAGTITIAAAVRPTTDQFTATSAHAVSSATFTLSQTPLNTKVWMFINGIRTNNDAYTISGTMVTYTAASNNNYTIVVGDRIQFDYAY